jgi:Icc-related predicted phosphoesterase
MNVGCVLLRDKVAEVKPKYQIFGHIHESYGRYYNQDTEFLNVAMTDEWNNLLNKGKLIHQPVIIEL